MVLQKGNSCFEHAESDFKVLNSISFTFKPPLPHKTYHQPSRKITRSEINPHGV